MHASKHRQKEQRMSLVNTISIEPQQLAAATQFVEDHNLRDFSLITLEGRPNLYIQLAGCEAPEATVTPDGTVTDHARSTV
jgi:hypothetical protein